MSDFEWLDCEDAEFVGHIYDLAMPVHLGEHDYDALVSIAPDRAYVVDVHYRTRRLVARFESLNMVYQMLAVDELPIKNPLATISRESWTRIILDVLLVRLTSVRDCSFLLVAEIFELGIDPRDVSIRTLRNNPNIPADPFNNLLADIANIGRKLRDERDQHLHRGEERSLGADPITYKLASFFESIDQPLAGNDIFGNPIDLDKQHKQVMEEIQAEFTSIAKEMESKILELFEVLYPFFLKRFRAKRKLSKLD